MLVDESHCLWGVLAILDLDGVEFIPIAGFNEDKLYFLVQCEGVAESITK